MEHKFLYIAAPMTGYLDYNRPAILAMAEFLSDNYPDRIIPLHTAWMPLGYPWERYMDVAYSLIRKADGLLLFEDWIHSKGCRAEINHASMLGIRHFLEVKDNQFRSINFAHISKGSFCYRVSPFSQSIEDTKLFSREEVPK